MVYSQSVHDRLTTFHSLHAQAFHYAGPAQRHGAVVIECSDAAPWRTRWTATDHRAASATSRRLCPDGTFTDAQCSASDHLIAQSLHGTVVRSLSISRTYLEAFTFPAFAVDRHPINPVAAMGALSDPDCHPCAVPRAGVDVRISRAAALSPAIIAVEQAAVDGGFILPDARTALSELACGLPPDTTVRLRFRDDDGRMQVIDAERWAGDHLLGLSITQRLDVVRAQIAKAHFDLAAQHLVFDPLPGSTSTRDALQQWCEDARAGRTSAAASAGVIAVDLVHASGRCDRCWFDANAAAAWGQHA